MAGPGIAAVAFFVYAAYCGSVGAMLHTPAGGANAVSAWTRASIALRGACVPVLDGRCRSRTL